MNGGIFIAHSSAWSCILHLGRYKIQLNVAAYFYNSWGGL